MVLPCLPRHKNECSSIRTPAPPGNRRHLQNEPVVPPFTWIGRGGAGLHTSHGDQTVPDAAKQPLVNMTDLQINNGNNSTQLLYISTFAHENVYYRWGGRPTSTLVTTVHNC